MLTTTVFRCSQQNLRLFAPAFYTTRRTYALSRFPQRSPGVGRRRQHVERDNPQKGTPRPGATREEVPHEDQPSSEASSLWQESARSINSDPAEGLKRLLMTNETLVFTRSALFVLLGILPLTSTGNSQIEMLNIFVGFEQTNKYAISVLSSISRPDP